MKSDVTCNRVKSIHEIKIFFNKYRRRNVIHSNIIF
nr:MAG TPA: hypothetical protein [Caudoviricetes sp.]